MLKKSIRMKLTLPYIVLGVMMLFFVAYNYYFINTKLNDINETRLLVDNIRNSVNQVGLHTQTGILLNQADDFIMVANRSLETIDLIEEFAKNYPEQGAVVMEDYVDYFVSMVAVQSLFHENRMEEGTTRLARARVYQDDINNSLAVVMDEIRTEQQGLTNYLNLFMAVMIMIMILLILLIVFVILPRYILNPVEKISMAVSNISMGEMNAEITYESQDEIGQMAAGYNKMRANVANVIHDIKTLAAAASEGQLDVRADAEPYRGDFRAIVEEVNATLDAVTRPLNVAAAYVERISNGDIPEQITGEYQGGFNQIKNNLNRLIAATEEVTAVNKALAAGNTAVSIAMRSEKDEMMRSMQNMIDTVKYLGEDMNMLVGAAVEGRLNTRADATRHQGDFRAIVEGVNDTINALVGHLDNMPLPVVIINQEFDILYVNNTGQALLNKNSRQLLGSKCYEHYKTSHCNTSDCACSIAMEEGRKATGETGAHLRGMDLDIKYLGTPIKDRHGNIIGVINVIIDQTEIMTARRSAQKMADKIKATTDYLKTSADALLEIAEKMRRGSEQMNDEISQASGAVEEITASIDNTAELAGESSKNINTIASAIEEMSQAIRSTAGSAEHSAKGVSAVNDVIAQNNVRVEKVSASAQDVEKSVGMVATAVKEFNISLSEVSENCEKSQLVAVDAKEKADSTNIIIEKLNQSSRQIGNIVGVINNIANQTNMLALNAAIEAVGAGEAGKGFAVVANEVKGLARQTALATGEISEQIETMQKNMSAAVEAVGRISAVIDEIGEFSSTIAAAVSEQTASVSEISHSVVNSADRVSSISQEIADISAGLADIAKSSAEADQGVQAIANAAAELTSASGEVAENTEQASDKMRDLALYSGEISHGAAEIATNINEIAEEAAETTDGSRKINDAARELAGIAEELDQLMQDFKV